MSDLEIAEKLQQSTKEVKELKKALNPQIRRTLLHLSNPNKPHPYTGMNCSLGDTEWEVEKGYVRGYYRDTFRGNATPVYFKFPMEFLTDEKLMKIFDSKGCDIEKKEDSYRLKSF